MSKKVLLIGNSSSGSSDAATTDDLVRELSALGSVDLLPPVDREDFARTVSKAASGASFVIVAAGDGTVNLTVNALSRTFDDLVFGVVPMGTGNDLCRTLGIPPDPIEAARSLIDADATPVDVGMASGKSAERFFVNACMGGFPVQVDEAIDEETKERLGPLAFWYGGLSAARNLQRHDVSMAGRDISEVIAAGVGSGRTCGGGVQVWPKAEVSDGLLDGCVMPADGVLSALELALKVKGGDHVEIDGVVYHRDSSIRIEAEPAMEFNVDGEIIGLKTPVTFEVATRARFLIP
jgi:diacylglycerol kinase (ATP)